jgi:predicted RNase H-like HicB family nuclease
MFDRYLQKALIRADYKVLENGEWFVSIPGFDGVWANGESVEETRNELIEVLEEWLLLKLKDNDLIPFFDSLEITEEKEFV